jgi:tRNA (cytidine/uridine-2'-O-)-methyltransferase
VSHGLRSPARRKAPPLQIALYQPDIAANAAAVIRLAACLDVPVHVVEPCGFVWDDRRLRRVGMDYLAHARIARHPSWPAFERWRASEGHRLVLLTTGAERPYHETRYRLNDVLLGGRESAGVPDEVRNASDLQVRIPLAPGRRSLNLVTALAMVAGESLRQLDAFPVPPPPGGA